MRRVVPLLALFASVALASPSAAAPKHTHGGCRLPPGVEHVVYIQFDNTHFRRDNPNVPSDLEQMPSLLNFIRHNGTLFTNDHTVLISHTAGGILSSLTGLYPDRHGQTVSNSYVRTSSTGGFSFPSSFGYWTDSVAATGTPTVPNMITPEGKNAPAPWPVYTRAGCDVGAIATANIVLENVNTTATGDVTKVFGVGSPQWNEAEAARLLPNTPANAKAKAQPQADFVGFAVHCAAGSAVCAAGQNDLLPEEVGGYTGFKALFGAQQINPLLTGQPATTPLTDLLGQPVTDPLGNPGFPGFDGMSAAVSLAYMAAMLEHGIPVTYAYISDAHDFHGVAGNQHVAFGPGSQGYVDQLAAYEAAFSGFFARLAVSGITRHNTLFVFTVDEGDHFVGVQKTGCDGVTTPCVYAPNEVGEINANIDTLVSEQFPALAAQFLGAGAPNAFTVHGDDAPTFYLARKGAGGGQLGQTDPLARQFEQSVANLTAVNPYTGATDRLMVRMADQTGMRMLHMMVDADPSRNPSFVFFADPDYFLTDFPASTCKTCINPLFAWNHGDIQPEIANTWLGFVGPGVHARGTDRHTWSDHADVRPTILTLLGLQDTYVHDGRALIEALQEHAQPVHLRGHEGTLGELLHVYKQINAPFGRLAQDTLTVATAALASADAGDTTYTALQSRIAGWTARRDALAGAARAMLDGATFQGDRLHEHDMRELVHQARALLHEVHECAENVGHCTP
ncbi:MAG TPA: hypothetical protein VMQ51_04025 [Candidatus Binatia bacterium]|nr:hypothetical protein [Candidatus Binatia bacterium]